MSEEVNKILQAHFEDDTKQFKKLEELATINGSHLSYFNKNLEEVKMNFSNSNKNLEELKKMLEISNKIDEERWKRIEPIVTSSEEAKVTFKWLKKKGGFIIAVIGVIVFLSSSWTDIKAVLSSILNNLLK